MDWFENWFGSPYYKILYQNRDEQEAQAFVEALLTHLQPQPGCRMLDIACGEGRFARQLAGHGFDVTGIDISERSIETAKEWENDTLHFYVHDMRLPFYTNYFDYAFNFFTSFGYFAHDRDNALAAKSFSNALKPGGILVIDYLNKQYVHDNLVAEETVKRCDHTFHIKRKFERKHFLKDISLDTPDGTQIHYTESVAAFSLDDFIRLMGMAGLTLESTYGDYKMQPYDEKCSQRLIMIFRKKHA